ncbi:Cupredoxin [Eremomyces bilateralis CBS 781.70]|uniref:Cupredoxin n=1 Tax=Eremomyces bilateralis CBS 781.70 TaxID=1392243 RepID=A0A6G1FX10_9PEZI|nr:Cupredoxin [Eremomyces bilateralis CBS 781.70]KAF1810159.1 Cupredoxin [Eremomyces bilateralis CBS 781.70]
MAPLGNMRKMGLEPSKKHLLRIVNVGFNNYFHVSLDNHPFTVVAADFIPIKPFTTTSLVLGGGQRYDVIIDANQAVGNYWFRTKFGGTADDPYDGRNRNAANIKNIFSYNGAPQSRTEADNNLVRWLVKVSAVNINRDFPTLQYVLDWNTDCPSNDNVYTVDKADENLVGLLGHPSRRDPPPIPYPVHLHGHGFRILGSGINETFDASSLLNFDNPIRRNTTSLPALSWIVLTFPADNPGAWLMHFLIPFHIATDLGHQFLE